MDIIALEKQRMAWSFRTFPEATQFSSLSKLKEEIKEVHLALLPPFGNDEETHEEYADCLMCLFDSAGRAGISVEQIFVAFEKKLAINMERKWIKNPDNTYSHIK